ncbi:T7SS effector LXG polymorphic toxin [Macrococcus capreoli]
MGKIDVNEVSNHLDALNNAVGQLNTEFSTLKFKLDAIGKDPNFKGAAADNISNYFDAFHYKNIESINEVNEQFKLRYERALNNFKRSVDDASDARVNSEEIDHWMSKYKGYRSDLFSNVMRVNAEVHKLYGITTAQPIDNRIDQEFDEVTDFMDNFLIDFDDYIANNRSEADFMRGEVASIKGLSSLVNKQSASARMDVSIVSALIKEDEEVRKDIDENRGLNKVVKWVEDKNKILEQDVMGILKDRTGSNHFLMVYGEKYLKDLLTAGKEYVAIRNLGGGKFSEGIKLLKKERHLLTNDETLKLAQYKKFMDKNLLTLKYNDISKVYRFYGLDLRLPTLNVRTIINNIKKSVYSVIDDKEIFQKIKGYNAQEELLKYKFHREAFTKEDYNKILRKNPELAEELKKSMDSKLMKQKLEIAKKAVIEELKFPKYINSKNLKYLFNIDQDFSFKNIKGKISKLDFSRENLKKFIESNAKSYQKNLKDLGRNISKTASQDIKEVIREFKKSNLLGKASKGLKYSGKILKPLGVLMVVQENSSIKDTQKRLVSTGVDLAALSGSAAAGAAVGAVIGGPVGIVAGVGVGIAADYFMGTKINGKPIKNHIKDGINKGINKGKEIVGNISKGFEGFGKKFGSIFGG